MSNKRVLFIVPLPPPIHGSSMISQYIRDSRVINETLDCDFVNLSTSRKMEEIGKGSFVKIWRLFNSFLYTLCLLLKHRYDCCFISITCHGKGFLKDTPFVLICKCFGSKIILHQENKGMSRDVDKWPYRWLMPYVYKDVKVLLLSWLLYPDVEKVVRRDQVAICPNCASGKVLFVKLHNKVPRILFLGNMIIGKGVLFLLDALEILKRRGYVFMCDYVGGETKEINSSYFESEVHKRNLDDMVMFHGPKVGEEKAKHLRNSDIFVFPTFYHNECFPLVLLEAMQYGLPIVTTDEGGIPDIVQDGKNGMICVKNNPQSLAKCIEKLLNDKQLREIMGRNGKKIFTERYTLEVFEKNLVDIIKDTIVNTNF